MKVASILKNIIKKNSTLSPAILIDVEGVFEDYVEDLEEVSFLSNPSNITLTKQLADKNVQCIYLRKDFELSGLVASRIVKKLDITSEMLFNEVDEIKGKIRGESLLSANQKIVLLKNFDSICSTLSLKDTIDDECIKKEILLNLEGKRVSSKGLLVQILNGAITRKKLVSLELYSLTVELLKKELLISITPYHSFDGLLEKVIITYSKNLYDEYGGASYSNYLLDVTESDIAMMARFIMDNVDELVNPIEELNEIYKNSEPIKLTYAIPRFFIKYIGNHLDCYIDEDKLWTQEMKDIGAYVLEVKRLEESLTKNISHQYAQNNLEFMFHEYKNTFANMDSLYRRVEAYYEKLALVPDFYLNEGLHDAIHSIKKKYHNVISKINGRLCDYYNQYMEDRKSVFKQSEFIESRKFNKRTLFILADGFRYEMAKELVQRFSGFEIEDVNVIGELPSETEIGMNSYFIIDEKVELSDKNSFVLKKDGKIEFYIYEWRRENLEKKLGCKVITFDDFKKRKDYEESVIFFFDEADINMHHFDSASKMADAIDNLERVIRYTLGREYDVVLLSDHGFVDIEKKIDVQDKSITSEKKKSRYLILDKAESAKDMFYIDSINGAEYLEMGNKKLCFINSSNSLKETSKYNHGGISFQENVITSFIIHGAKEEASRKQNIIFEMIKAYNEITGKIRGANGYICSIMSGTDVVFNVMIDVEEYQLHVPIRQYENGTDFLLMVSNGDNTEKTIVKKEGGRVIDKDLDIF